MVGLLRKARLFPAICTLAAIALVQSQAWPAENVVYETTGPSQTSQVGEAVAEDSGVVPEHLAIAGPAPARIWTIDYRCKSFLGSHTSYEVGTFEPPSQGGWAPLSRLRFPLDSTWNGIEVGVERPKWEVHGEWLTPISQHINGFLADSDWTNPADTTELTDLGFMRERWTDGQTVTLDVERKLCDSIFGLPVEVWPIVGFRWQRFDLTAYDLDQVKSSGGPPFHVDGDIITFNQQYYICYVGGQFRRTIKLTDERQLRLTFQGDWGATWAYNIDNHLRRGFFATQADQGDSWHLALIGEFPMTRWLSLGVQADFLQIQTSGTDRQSDIPTPRTNGVRSYSDQTSVTAFARLNY